MLAGLGSLGGRCAGQQASRQQAERHVRQAVAMCGMVRQCLAEWCGRDKVVRQTVRQVSEGRYFLVFLILNN